MPDSKSQILKDLLGKEEITLTDDQDDALHVFLDFLKSKKDYCAYLLTGSAGTGKTFLINLFSRILKKSGYNVILLAPTGRAAKVISKRTKRLAYTIHHHIYSPIENSAGEIYFDLKENKDSGNVVYIVDEASMIGNHRDSNTQNNLLIDLLSYIYTDDQSRKLIIVGDPVQLPPVGHNDSPALDPDLLKNRGSLKVFHAHLSEVRRQLVDSGVLENAVLIRDAYQSGKTEKLLIDPNRDVQMLESPWEALEAYMGYFVAGDQDRVVFLTYSNFRSTRVNQAIRKQLFDTEDILLPTDLVMVVKNNYAWGDPKKFPFIANGEMGTVRHVYPETREKRYGLEFMDVEIEFQDTRGEPFPVECKVVLNLLQDKQPQIPSDVMYRVVQERRQEYLGLSKNKAGEMMRTDPYVNALQIKYGYSITGHKSQGGQWENVIIGFEPDYGNDMQAYVRWAYTVFTRAEKRVFLLNCPFVKD
ncbi:MAG: AAA family ATPase [Bacteroidia bacterium]|nr:AAA family ATPase [Bacteroidia bacterium]